jgi:hypothetical protein
MEMITTTYSLAPGGQPNPAWGHPRPANVSDYIEAAVTPYVSPELISPAAMSSICGIASSLPGALTDFFGFECHLGSADPVADFLVCARTEQGGRDVLAGRKPDRDLHSSCYTHPVWRQIRAFADAWSDPKSPLFEGIHNLWLEFDINGVPEPIPVPSVFVGSDLCKPLSSTADVGVMPEHCGWLTSKVLPTLLNRSLDAQVERQIATCLNLLPEGAGIFQTGVMLARASRAIRLCVRGLSPDEILPYLIAIAWTGSRAETGQVLDELRSFAARIDLDLDVSDCVLPKIGLECYLPPDTLQAPNVERFAEYLRSAGLATSSKARALRAWRGLAHERHTPERWPRELLGISGFLGGRVHSVFLRWLHHVKVVCEPGVPPQAKAYLAVQHGWLPPEALKGMIGAMQTPPREMGACRA